MESLQELIEMLNKMVKQMEKDGVVFHCELSIPPSASNIFFRRLSSADFDTVLKTENWRKGMTNKTFIEVITELDTKVTPIGFKIELVERYEGSASMSTKMVAPAKTDEDELRVTLVYKRKSEIARSFS
jgi:hypothetical protein